MPFSRETMQPPSKTRPDHEKSRWRTWNSLTIVAFLALILFLVQFGLSLNDMPGTSIMQQILCHHYYGDTSDDLIPPGLCLSSDIQSELNTINVGITVSSIIPGFVVALPLASLADRWGRKPILGLSIFGLLLNQIWSMAIAYSWHIVSPRAIWSAGIALFIGGGIYVAEAMVFAIVSDITSETKRAMYFQAIICSVLLGELLGNIAANGLLKVGLWDPIFVGIGFIALGGLLIPLLPETLSATAHLRDEDYEESMTLNSPGSTTPMQPKPQAKGISRTNVKIVLKETTQLLLHRRILLLFPAASLVVTLASASMGVLLRYIPLRFGLSLSDANLLQSLRAGLHILVLVIFLPLLTWVFRGNCPIRRDLSIARISTVPLVIGMIVLAASPTVGGVIAGLIVFTLGSGIPGLARAILSESVAELSVGRVFGALAILDLLSALLGNLAVGALFEAGLRGAEEGESGWLGLPFYVVALIWSLASVCLWFAQPRQFRGATDMGVHEIAAGVPRRP